jgi:DNA-binding NarL/FixJ family response regulator
MVQKASSLLSGSNGSTLSDVAAPAGSQAEARKGREQRGHATPSRDGVPAAEKPVLVYLDKLPLARDCLGNQLAIHLPEWWVESRADIQELEEGVARPQGSLVILRAYGASLRSAEVADAIARTLQRAANAPVILLSDLDDPAEVAAAMRLGVRGYLPGSLSLSQVVGAIRLVAGGGTYVPACMLDAAPAGQATAAARPTDGRGNPIDFSPRQVQVLELLMQGKQNKIIAYELSMCESTAKVHIRNIMRRLNARNRTQVVSMIGKTYGRAAASPA